MAERIGKSVATHLRDAADVLDEDTTNRARIEALQRVITFAAAELAGLAHRDWIRHDDD